jgi:hypothetical protein
MKVLYFPPLCDLCRKCCSKNMILDMISHRNLCIQAGVLLKLAVKHKLINIHRNVLDLILEYVFWQKPLKFYRYNMFHSDKKCMALFGLQYLSNIFPSLVSAYFVEFTCYSEFEFIGYPIFCESIVVGRVVSTKFPKIRGVCWVPGISNGVVDILYRNSFLAGIIVR